MEQCWGFVAFGLAWLAFGALLAVLITYGKVALDILKGRRAEIAALQKEVERLREGFAPKD